MVTTVEIGVIRISFDRWWSERGKRPLSLYVVALAAAVCERQLRSN